MSETIHVTPVYDDADQKVPAEAAMRLRRLRGLAWLLDRSIPLGNGRSIGLDPLIGLIPGVGDFVASAASFYIIYEASRLGLPRATLLKMVGNVALETIVGIVPVAGDLFDFAWQANTRNLRLIETHYSSGLAPRPAGRLLIALVAAALLLLGLAAAGLFFLARWVWGLLS